MIDIKIKTLDGNNHPFHVDDEITVQELKDKILESMGVEIGHQRLIFCGRVLQDDKKLRDYGVHGKVIHMVQRAPPSVEAQQAARDGSSTPSQSSATHSEPITISPVHFMNSISHTQFRRFMARAARLFSVESDEPTAESHPPTAARLESVRRLIMEIKTTLEALKSNERDEPVDPSEEPLESASSGSDEPGQPEGRCPIHQRPIGERGRGATRSARGRRYRMARQTPLITFTQPIDLGQLVHELHEIENEFVPFREMYVHILREASDPTVTLTEQMLLRRQRTAELCGELYHALGHAYHTIGDIELQMERTPNNSRITSDGLFRNPQLHAQINVVQAGQSRGAANATASGSGTSQPSTSVPETQANTPQAGTSTQPTASASAQPDPVTYQVEIETALPIINFENVFMNDANTTQGGQSQTNQSQLQSQNGTTQQQQDGQNDRPPVMIEFENLLRGLGQEGLANVEVMMSVEEIRGQGDEPQAGGGAENDNSGLEERRPQVPTGVILSQSANLIHSIMSSAARQAIAPGMEEVVHTAPPPSGQNQQQSQGQDQGQGQSQGQPQSRPQTRFLTDIPPFIQYQLPNHLAPQPQSSSRPGTSQRVIAAQPEPYHTLVYDRFLPCESVHARRQLQKRRDQSAQAARARNRHNSLTRIQNNVIALYERFDRYAIDDESLMIATVVFMRESIAMSSGQTLDIDQLFPLRHRLRVHVWQLMNGEYAAGSEEQLCDVILERQSEFINRIGTITPLQSDVDLVASLRAVLTHFLNEAALLINVDRHYVFCRRFRTLFSQMFYDICGVISNCCQDGVEGLRKIYRAFMIDLIKNIDEPAREQLLSLAMDNLETAVRSMEIWSSNYLQYVRRIPSACKIEEQATVQESAESTSVKTEVTEDDVDVTIKKETEEPYAWSEPSVEHSSMDWQIPVPEPMDTDIEVMPAEAAEPVVDSAPMPAPIATSSPQQTPGEVESSTQNASQDESQIEIKTQDVSAQNASENESLAKKTQDISAQNSTQNENIENKAQDVPTNQNQGKPRQEILHTDSGGQSSQSTSAASTSVGPVDGFLSARTGQNRRIAQSRGRQRHSRQLNSNSTTTDSSNEAGFVPPAQLAQHWGEEWVPTLSDDQHRQRAADSDEPFSDAYLSGMPPKKRRCVRDARPSVVLDAFIAESVREVATPLTAVSDEWRALFREELTREARRRVARSADYEPDRFTATARFLAQTSNPRPPSDTEEMASQMSCRK